MRARELSEFCMEMYFLLEAGIPLDGGLELLAEDVSSLKEKCMLQTMASSVEQGEPLASVMETSGQFPAYVVQMAQVGQETGTLDTVMKSLADYYDKESNLAQTIKNAITYPLLMVFMLLMVLFVLLTKVMPIFERVYQQLGAQLSPITIQAMKIGSIVSGTILAFMIALGFVALGIAVSTRCGHKVQWAEYALDIIKQKSKIAVVLAKRRLAAILAISVKSGLPVEKGVALAADIVQQKKMQAKIELCRGQLDSGELLYDALRVAAIFTGIDLQMIKVGVKSGRLEEAFEKIAQKYETEVDTSVDNMIARFEPTMVIVLAVTVGLILLSVMMPLVGIMATIG